MGDKDLEKVLAEIQSSEKKDAVKQAQMDRMKELSEKQKKIITDLEKIIEEQKKKIDSMFDVPADIQELKRMIGAQRAELNDKDQKLEYSYAKIAELQQELKTTSQTQSSMSQNFDSTFAQIGQLKAELGEKKAALVIKDSEINSLYAKIQELQKVIGESQRAISNLQDEVRNRDLMLIDEKSKIEAKLKEEIFAQKDEAFKKVKMLEQQLMDKELASKEKLSTASESIKNYNDIKQKYEDLIAKYDAITSEDKKIKEELKSIQEEIVGLREFKIKNETEALIFTKMKKLMERDTFYQIFAILWDVGEISLNDLKNAVRVPTVTIQKYVNDYIAANILKVSDEGKISLVDRKFT